MGLCTEITISCIRVHMYTCICVKLEVCDCQGGLFFVKRAHWQDFAVQVAAGKCEQASGLLRVVPASGLASGLYMCSQCFSLVGPVGL